MDANDPKKGGSFYLQSKVYRAKEELDKHFGEEAEQTNSQQSTQQSTSPTENNSNNSPSG